MRSSHYLDQAWEIARQHRMNVIDAIKGLPAPEGQVSVYEVHDVTLASDVADILARDREYIRPVLVYANAGDSCKISARCPAGVTTELGPLVNKLAAACGGNGGGHIRRAGATIPCDKVGMFTKGWQEALAS